MTAKEAFNKLTSRVGNMRVTSCHEYDSVFVFQLAPETAKNPSRLLTGLTSVDKKSGLVKTFKPFDISIDEYQRGKVIPMDSLGGEM